MTDPGGRLLYLSYGQGPHVAHIAFSILSAHAAGGAVPPTVVFTDRPEDYEGLGAECVRLDPAQLREWRGPRDFNHVVKLEVLRVALERFAAPCLYVDGDTYFRRPPARVLARIGPGRSVMHLREGRVGLLGQPEQRKLADALAPGGFTDRAGAPLELEPQATLWNAGVLGLHPADAPLLDDAIHLTHQVYERSGSHIAEQFAISYFMDRRTRVEPSSDAVYHYWPYLRSYDPPFEETAFSRTVQEVVARTAGMPLEQRAAEVARHRYRPPLLGEGGRLYWPIRNVLESLGAKPPSVRRSV